jgi:hypothetical protein
MEPIYGIHFNEQNHIYTVTKKVDGVVEWQRIKQSVTQVMTRYGFLDVRWIKPYYLERGTLVHEYCVLRMQGWLDWATVREDCIPFVKTFERLVWQLGLEYVDSERPCYSPQFDICGTFDIKALWDGRKTVVELKTGDFDMYHGIQLCSYEEMLGGEIEDVLGLSLKEEGKVFGKAPDWQKNHEAWRDICTGKFDLNSWKKDKKRRRMRRIL